MMIIILASMQIGALEARQQEMEKAFEFERRALWDVIMKQNQLILSLHKKRKFQKPIIN